MSDYDDQLERLLLREASPEQRLPLPKRHPYQRNWWFFTILLSLFLPTVITYAGVGYYHALLTSYSQTSCIIQSGSIESRTYTTKTGSEERFYPMLSFTVLQGDKQLGSAQGYDGPEASYYGTKERASTILQKYRIGENYPCWYRYEQGKLQAVLSLQGLTQRDIILRILITWFTTLPIVIASMAFGLIGYKAYLLRKRGVSTRGQVLSWKKVKQRGVAYYRPTVTFLTVSYPVVEHEGIGPLQESSEGREVQVIYDPHDIRNFSVGPRAAIHYLPNLSVAIILLLAVLAMHYLFWIMI